MKPALLFLTVVFAGWGCSPSAPVQPQAVAPSPQTGGGQTSDTTGQKPVASPEPAKSGRIEQPKAAKPADEGESRLFRWAKTMDEGLGIAKSEHMIVVLKFEASWCAPCQIMKHEAFQDAEVAKILKRSVIVPVDVDTEEGQKLAGKYHADVIPHMEFLKADGTSFGKLVGYSSVDWLKKNLKAVLAKA